MLDVKSRNSFSNDCYITWSVYGNKLRALEYQEREGLAQGYKPKEKLKNYYLLLCVASDNAIKTSCPCFSSLSPSRSELYIHRICFVKL